MQVEIKCYATLKAKGPKTGKVSLDDDATVRDALQAVNMPISEVKLIFLNGIHSTLEAKLKAGDRLGIFPPVGGG